MKEIKNSITKYRNCTINYVIREEKGTFSAHAQVMDPSTENIETVWSDEKNPYKTAGEAEVGIIGSAKKMIDDIIENK